MIAIKYASNSALTGAATTDAVPATSGDDFTVALDMAGLTPNTQYWYTPVIDGTDQYTSDYPSFKTFPANGSGTVFKFAFGSCTGQAGNDTIFSQVPSDTAFLLHLGDTAYQATNTTLAQFRTLQQQHLVGASSWCSGFKSLRRSVPVFSMADDNDYGNGGAQETTEVKALAYQAWQEYSGRSNPDSPTAGALYYPFQVGDVGFFVLDERSYASPVTATDDYTKTMLGADQLSALKDWLLTNNDTLKIKFICSPTPASGYGTTGGDSWGGDWTADQLPHGANGYRYERNNLLDYIDDNAITGVIFLAADNHWAYSCRYMYGKTTARPRYEWMASPFNQAVHSVGSTTPDPVNGPIFWSYGGSGNNSMGVVTVDTTVTPATVSYQLYSAAGSLGSSYLTTLTQDDIDLDLGDGGGGDPTVVDYWDATRTDASIAIAGPNGTDLATKTGAAGWKSAIGKTAIVAPVYFEVVLGSTAGSNTIIGVGDDSASTASYPGNDVHSWGLRANGTRYHVGTTAGFGTYTANDVLGFAINPTTGNGYIRKNGTWLDGGPAGSTPTFVGLTGTLYAMGTCYLTGNTLTLRAKDSEFGTAPPGGYTSLSGV